MKRVSRAFAFSLLFTVAVSSFAKKTESIPEKDLYEYNNIVANLVEAGGPKVLENFIVFTADAGPRFMGISFDFENYKTVHKYERHVLKDVDGNMKKEILFYVLERPKKIEHIEYRLVIDGLWTNDPSNELSRYDQNTGLILSCIELKDTSPELTELQENSSVKFVYKGEIGLQVRLAGTFTSWDSWIYELSETKPGFYELTLPLPRGKYYYRYFIGMNSVVDKTNPNRAYAGDGMAASVITVD